MKTLSLITQHVEVFFSLVDNNLFRLVLELDSLRSNQRLREVNDGLFGRDDQPARAKYQRLDQLHSVSGPPLLLQSNERYIVVCDQRVLKDIVKAELVLGRSEQFSGNWVDAVSDDVLLDQTERCVQLQRRYQCSFVQVGLHTENNSTQSNNYGNVSVWQVQF